MSVVTSEGTPGFVLFPGQGSQVKGMGKTLFDRFPEAVAAAGDVLGYDLRKLCLEDPDGLLDDTRYTQPALYAVNALAYRESLEEGAPEGGFLLGHSLGEYNALHAAGAFDFETGLRLVLKRGELMAQARQGGMLALLGPAEDELLAVLAEERLEQLDVANINTPTQTVLSGPAEEIERAERLFGGRRVRTVRLKVSAAFHSRLMKPAGEEFRAFLKGFRFGPLRATVIANVTARPYGDIAATLSEQISGPVRWLESVRHVLAHASAADGREVGPGSVLTRMLHQIAAESGSGSGARTAAATASSAPASGATASAAPAPSTPVPAVPVDRAPDAEPAGRSGGAPDRPRPVLYCAAYAGGDERSYAGLAEHCPGVDVVTLERPGRGKRVSEPLLTEPGPLVEDMLERIRDRVSDPHHVYGLYGHSLGARLVHLLARRLREEQLPAPRRLFVSGECGPSLPSRERYTSDLPTDAFWKHLRELGGVPDELFEYEDLKNFFERVLRADFTVLGACAYTTAQPLDCPVTAMTGDAEGLTEAEVAAWQRETTAPLSAHVFTGDHFFIRAHWPGIARVITSGLASC
ncbi:ACP S-malonyltransferase [Streptomyces winkii]|uniref:ACP S-malonyltransferase n=1 Tax=Streptomyces winkii TaxID=3051178 RepID=UPI0028D1C2D3|nr:ACP S-malonyltransferase [Streptomyces sp. DSM 40971]